jgi:hypothetical protein
MAIVSVAPPIELFTVDIVAEFQLKDQSQYSSRKKLKEQQNGFGVLAQPHRDLAPTHHEGRSSPCIALYRAIDSPPWRATALSNWHRKSWTP